MTETRDPVAIGGLVEKTVGQLYHDQMLLEYWQAGEQITLNALVMLCLTAREFDHRVKFVLLDDSDQGEWQYVAGLSATLPVQAGDYEADTVDLHDEFDDEGWASSIDDRTKHVWEPFLVKSESMPYWSFLDVDKVLAEVHLPWRPVKSAPCRHEGGSEDCPPACLLIYGDAFVTEAQS